MIDPAEVVDYRTPIDDLEPLENNADEVRMARVKAVALINSFAACIERALSAPEPDLRGVASAFWSAAFALGCNICRGSTMTDCAIRLGVTRATISKGARAFCSAHGLEPSYYMKREEASESYAVARLRSIEKANGPMWGLK